MASLPQRLVCPRCGGTEIHVSAIATWDEEKQDWDFSVDYGADDYCADCSDYVAGDFVDLSDLKAAALVAIKQNEVV
jgi:hypothetical protein